MGKTISEFSLLYEGISCLEIYCGRKPEYVNETVSVNAPLADILLNIEPRKRSIYLERAFLHLLNNYPDDVIVKDIDIMFNPEYKVDVLKILISTYKQKKYSLIWPGTWDDKKLIYGEPGFIDYRTYNIDDYDVICIR